MADPQVQQVKGVALEYEDPASTWNAIAQITSLSLPEVGGEVAEVRTVDQTTKAIIQEGTGYVTVGQLSGEFMFHSDLHNTLLTLAADTAGKNWRVTMPVHGSQTTGDRFTVSGANFTFSVTGTAGSFFTGSFNIQANDIPTFAAGT